MSSIWSSGAATLGASPFTTTGMAPAPGGGAATRFQSALQSAGAASQSTTRQVGLSSKAAVGQTVASPADSSSGSSSTSDSGSTISANDFLTLLVTEMQNQDPTSQTDPNEYINQLVQINSLEQLISINQNLAEVLGAATSPVPPTTSAAPNSVSSSAGAAGTPAGRSGAVRGSLGHGAGGSSGAARGTGKAGSATGGNLSLPKPSPASRTVAHALDGHGRAGHRGHAIRDIPTQAIAR